MIVGPHVYRLHKPGVVECWEAATGKKVYTGRLPGISTTWASPVMDGDGRLYFASAGKSYIIQSGPEFRILAVNDLGDGNHPSPAVAQGRLFLVGLKTSTASAMENDRWNQVNLFEVRIREAADHEVRQFFRDAAERDWDGLVPPFIDWGRLHDCDGFTVAENQGEIIGAIATASQGMDGSTLPTIANVYVLRNSAAGALGLACLRLPWNGCLPPEVQRPSARWLPVRWKEPSASSPLT